ncbi:uncharacterized protein V1516DRAFT_624039 [Lipomyces oligophaga]|uniref:uncharacterized protein n=1 Tax=Lipomyces oligophaga TaxID=45792 RepID=UPI0034CEE08A
MWSSSASPAPTPSTPTASSSSANTPATLPYTFFDADLASMPTQFRRKPLHSSKRVKNARQTITDESKRLQAASTATATAILLDRPNYLNVEAPPSVVPRKWYCDITGLKGTYKMPGNGLRYYNKEIFEVIKGLPPGVDQQYLQLRGANVVLK